MYRWHICTAYDFTNKPFTCIICGETCNPKTQPWTTVAYNIQDVGLPCMGILAGKPITKVTLFLYTEDIEKLRRLEGYGWSAKVREVMHQWLKLRIKTQDFPEE